MDIELNRIMGENLRTIRIGQGVTQVELAVQCQDVVYAPGMTNRDGSRML